MIIEQLKVSRVSLWIGHCHISMEGPLKLHLQSLQEGEKWIFEKKGFNICFLTDICLRWRDIV